LQEEFLRLQSELGKTIVFVTHDIDEAIRLGDRIAVMRVGGRLAQVATPAELLNRPVDGFVAGFLGRDRGYRALGFQAAGPLPLRDEPVAVLGDDVARVADRAHEGWLLVVDADRRPQGWLAPGGPEAAVGVTVAPELLHLGGTLAEAGGSLRAALDASLSSPSGRGVVVDGEGRLLGTVRAAEVLTAIEVRAVAVRQADERELSARVEEAAVEAAAVDAAQGAAP